MTKLPLLTLLAMCLATAVSADTTFYLSPDGNDAWSGQLAAPNAGRTDGPFCSLPRAQEAVRDAKAADPQATIAVELREGTYPLAETLVFSAADSGTPAVPIVWRAHGDERPVLSGGQVIEGFQETTANGLRRWTATLPKVKQGEWNFRQLFISVRGGAYQRRYRPHLGMLGVDHLTYSPRRQAARHRAAQPDFVFYPGDIQQWENLADVEVVIPHMWSSSRMFIKQVDLKKRVVTFTGLPTFAVGQVGPHNPYYVENVKSALDEPGEWYLDRPTGLLTYLPREGETLPDCRLVAPVLDRVMALEADYLRDQFVSDLRFEHLTFSHNESPLPAEGYGGSQAQPDLPAAIEATGARRCEFLRCTIAQTGNYGAGLGLGCHDNRLIGCRLYDLGGGGIKIGDIRMPNKAEAPTLPTGNAIENCAISDGGLMYYSANAIWAGIVRDTVIAHNEIWNFPYSGIAVGWSWSEQPTSCANNKLEFNEIHHVVQLLADGASIYTLGRQPGTVIRGNVLHDNVRGPHARQFWQLGLYLDEGSSEMLVENNLAYRCGTHGFNINGGGENLIQNNIFGPVYGNDAPFVRCYGKHNAQGNVFTHNLCYTDSPNLADVAWDKQLLTCRENLYWNFAGQPFQFRDKSWEQWQAMGQDEGSVNADPLFVDPDGGDYRLKPGSPALALGFKPFDASLAGLVAAYHDVAVPVTVTPPPVYSMQPAVIPADQPGFEIDCEDVPLGVVPREFGARYDDGHPEDARVTDEAAHSGTRSLKLTDRKGVAKTFLPYLTHDVRPTVTAGLVTFETWVRQDATSPCLVSFEFRDTKPPSGKQFAGGPGVFVEADGTVKADGQSFGQAKPGEWVHLKLEFKLDGEGRQATVTAGDQQATVPVPDDFRTASQLLIVCGADADGSCYVDDLALGFTP